MTKQISHGDKKTKNKKGYTVLGSHPEMGGSFL